MVKQRRLCANRLYVYFTDSPQPVKSISVCKPIRLRLTFPKREETLCPLVVRRINGKVGGNAVDSYYIVVDTGIFYLCSLDCDSRTVLKLLYTDKLVVADIDKPVVFETNLPLFILFVTWTWLCIQSVKVLPETVKPLSTEVLLFQQMG